MLADVKTAFLYGDAARSLYIELPPEDPSSASGGFVGKLGFPDDPARPSLEDTVRHEI